MIEKNARPSGQFLRHRQSMRAAVLLATTALTSPLLINAAIAQNLPTGGSVAAGSVSIAQPSATLLNITQSSASAVVNWQGFSVGQGSAVNIAQPNASSAILNRVTGDTPSSIAGQISANGSVYLVNPNGIAITSSGTVNAGGGFVASTLGISDSDFMSGKRTFSGKGASASVSNAGTIRVGRGGYAALIGGTVSNAGSIEVPLGKVGLGSGEQATLDFAGDGFLQVAVPTKSGGNDALIKHSGSIKSNGGSVTISAATAREAARNAINISGVVQARSIGGRSGAIIIGGGAGGAVKVSGKLNVASRQAKGGAIAVTGRNIVLEGATLNASGKTGGGTIKIGGDWQGQGDLQHAETTIVDAATTIKADARYTGDGGTVVVWSDGATAVRGSITARGGAQGGSGGAIETSGRTIDFAGVRIDASSSNGRAGRWLIDPDDLTVDASAAVTITNTLANTHVELLTTATTATGPGVITPGGAGDITIAAPLSWSGTGTLTLNAYHSIAINALITIAGAGGLDLNTNHGGGSGGTLSFAGGSVQYTGAANIGQSFRINGDTYTLVYSMSELQRINDSDAQLQGNYALAKPLDAGVVNNWVPIGTDGADGLLNSDNGFSGTLTGLGNTVTGLVIDRPTAANVGLFGYSSGTISDIGLIGGSVLGKENVGGLVGFNNGLVAGAYAEADVSGGDNAVGVGGLVGNNDGTITNSHAIGAVSGGQEAIWLGGLAGYNNGTITQSYAEGDVTGGDNAGNVGGLVGTQSDDGTITLSRAKGNVSGGDGTVNIGGLAGYSGGTIKESHAEGDVTGGNDVGNVGGLVGTQGGDGTTTQSSAKGNVTGGDGAANLGGLVGYNDGEIKLSEATGAVEGGTYVGGLVGENYGDITDSRAKGAVSGRGSSLGGLLGWNQGNITNSHATGSVTGGGDSYNLGGLIGENGAEDSPGGNIAGSSATGAVSGGENSLGGLVGSNAGGTITDSDATGIVRAGDYASEIGGLVGYNEGTLTGSHATGAVSGGNGTSAIGGLIGYNKKAAITDSYATGAVTGADYSSSLGGLIGANNGGDITRSHATGDVTGWENIGGLVGANTGGLIGGNRVGEIVNSYATGMINFSVADAASLGGLVGYNDGGRIIGSHATGAVNGGDGAIGVGGLVGKNDGTAGGENGVLDSYATGNVTGGSSSYSAGGLVGENQGTIGRSYASGAVNVGDDAQQAGGLAGTNYGMVANAYATGIVTGGADTVALGGLVGANLGGIVAGSYATGAVSGGARSNAVGGLVGLSMEGGMIGQVFATGAVRGGGAVGGLVGGLAGNSGFITQAYATGAVSSTGTSGGLVGERQGVVPVSESSWDTQTTGQMTSAGSANSAGQTTAQLQLGILPTGFQATYWATGSGLYPYLKSFFPTGLQVVSGFANKADGTAMASNINGAIYVSVISGGAVVGSATTGANGYYYIFLPTGSMTDTAGIATFTQLDATTGAQDAVAYGAGMPNPVVNSGVDLAGGWQRDIANSVTTLSALDVGYASTIGAAAPSAFAFTNRQIANSGSFDLDQALSVSGMLWLSGTGALTQSAALTTSALLLSGTGSFALANANNAIDNLAANAGSINVASNRSLTIPASIKNASGIEVSGITTTAGVSVATTDNLTIASGAGVSGASPVLMAGAAFLNNQGSNAVTATSGRWLVYSANPTGDIFNNLDSDATAIWNTAAGGAVSQAGNRYVFASQPTLTVTSANGTKTYGEDATAQVAEQYTVTGFDPGIAGAYLADTAETSLTGIASIASTGAPANANVAGSPYKITAEVGSLAAISGYAIAFNSVGTLTVTPAALTITATDAGKVYGQTATLDGFSTSGLQNGEAVGSVTLTSAGASATANVAGSPYAITASGASGGTFDAANYTISYVDGHLTVIAAPLTITADPQARIEGAANPILTYQIAGTQFNNDTITGALTTSATVASAIGFYPITQGRLAVSSNYILTYQGALLTVLPANQPSAPVIDPAFWASSAVRDRFRPIDLPDNAHPVFGAPIVRTALGTGVFYADPRFDSIFVCFGGGDRTLQACLMANL